MRSYKIYIDENLPHQLAEALNLLQSPQNEKDGMTIEVLSIKKVFGIGAADEDWIPKVGSESGIVITQDFNIFNRKHQKELYQNHGIGILFFNPPSKSGFSYWDMVKQTVNRWEKIKQIIRKDKPPFAYKCSAKTDFEKL